MIALALNYVYITYIYVTDDLLRPVHPSLLEQVFSHRSEQLAIHRYVHLGRRGGHHTHR